MRVQMFSSGFLILLFILNSILSINFTYVSGQCLQNQKELLLELKSNLTYDSSLSTKLPSWNESIDCCKWGGVKCDFKGRVTALDLSSESISGGITDSSNALFKFKFLQSLNLAQNTFDSVQLPSGFGKITSLSYLNLSKSGFSGQIPLEFSKLTSLVVFDLSSDYSSLNLENPNLKTLIHNFTKLRELYLDGVNISAEGYDWGSAISSSLLDLQVLSLSNTHITGPFDSSLAKLKSLSIVHLDGNTFSSPFPEFFADIPNLRVLTISSCDLFGMVPKKLFQITSLQVIDLSGNRDLEGSLPEFSMNGSLQNLLLSYTNFSGEVSESIGNLKMLSQVDLRACRFSGSIPNSFTNLTHLVYLDLSINHFTGNVPSFALLKKLTVMNIRANGLTGQIYDSNWEGLENLYFLDLSANSLEGEIPSSLFVLPSLKVLYLSNNRFYGSIRDLLKSDSSFSLESVELSANNLEGPVPRFFFELHNLSRLSLSRNKFNGSLEFTDFKKLTNLVSLDLSYNYLSVHVTEDVSMSSLLPRLSNLALASCKLQKIPLFKNQTSLMMLDLSNNILDGEIPNWIWEVGNGFLRFLNLSHNQFTSLQEPYNLRSLQFLDLHSNMLGGQIPVPPPSAALVDFSSNNFSSSLPFNIGNYLKPVFFFSVANNKIDGTIPLSLCDASRIQVLDLSNNSFTGRIPSCLESESLKVWNLSRNRLSGNIPDLFPLSCSLETLDLSWNDLTGQVPKSLAHCKNLEVLNLGNNNLNGTFPCSFKNLSRLHVLDLRSNTFYGNINCLSDNYTTWPNVQIINLASNKFDGVLPANLFRNMKAMMVDENGTQPELDHLNFVFLSRNHVYYQDSVTVTLKGQELELGKILTISTSVDFSNNHFRGVIPNNIGELKSLYVLNFSHNAISGHIPGSIGKLRKLESLDFSSNNLSGEIPKQIASLAFLSVLNLSYNHLVGRIPRGTQMQTFPESSFHGNERLCGFPLNKTCSDVNGQGLPEGKLQEENKSSDAEIYAGQLSGR
ncbi:hypothetical protein ACJIZ3_019001 [Penstemon smallii]|uniref:Leucine-rich repeat-containing N-terminal plant-type domain-containing protein n=1 Tax=Penstemon smallii TaxID=265156 RepID=A0ABD3SZY1_9LAMI